MTAPANNPAPALTSLSPISAVAGGAPFTLVLHGTGFNSTSVVHFGGTATATTAISSTQLQAAILASEITSAGEVTITVVNPAPGGGTSNGLPFNVSPSIGITNLITMDNGGLPRERNSRYSRSNSWL